MIVKIKLFKIHFLNERYGSNNFRHGNKNLKWMLLCEKFYMWCPYLAWCKRVMQLAHVSTREHIIKNNHHTNGKNMTNKSYDKCKCKFANARGRIPNKCEWWYTPIYIQAHNNSSGVGTVVVLILTRMKAGHIGNEKWAKCHMEIYSNIWCPKSTQSMHWWMITYEIDQNLHNFHNVTKREQTTLIYHRTWR